MFSVLFLKLIQLIPAWRRWLELGPKRAGLVRYQWEEGLPFCPNYYGGLVLPQVYCAPIDPSSADPRVMFSDDIIFRQVKDGMFQIVVLLKSLSELEESREALHNIEKMSDKYVIAGEATFIVQDSETFDSPGIGADVFRLATAAEFAATGLCKGRPEPQYYDMYRLSRTLRGKRFAVTRPDRFVYAACDTKDELEQICGGIQRNLGLV
jgi:hypothetical protein